MQPQCKCGSGIHLRDVEFAVGAPCEILEPRGPGHARVGNPVHIGAFECGEPRVETGRRHGNPMDGDIIGHHARQPGLQGLHRRQIHMADALSECLVGNIDVAHLMRGMHAGVGAPGHGEPQVTGIRHARDSSQGLLDGSLHRPAAWLRRPSVERGTVIGQVDS